MFALCKRNRQPRASRPQEHRQNIARTRKLKRRRHQAKPPHLRRLLLHRLLHQQPSAVAKKLRPAQQPVRLLHLLRHPQLRPKKAPAKRQRRQRVLHRRLPNSRLASCSSRKVPLQPVRRPSAMPLQRALAPQQLIRRHPAVATVACGLIPTRMCTTRRGRVFTARPRRANT